MYPLLSISAGLRALPGRGQRRHNAGGAAPATTTSNLRTGSFFAGSSYNVGGRAAAQRARQRRLQAQQGFGKIASVHNVLRRCSAAPISGIRICVGTRLVATLAGPRVVSAFEVGSTADSASLAAFAPRGGIGLVLTLLLFCKLDILKSGSRGTRADQGVRRPLLLKRLVGRPGLWSGPGTVPGDQSRAIAISCSTFAVRAFTGQSLLGYRAPAAGIPEVG